MTPILLRSTLIAALGGLLFGFDTAVISGTTEWLREVYRLSPGGLGFTVAAALIGTICGALLAGRPADRWGRRTVLFAIAWLYLLSALGTALAWDWYSFLFFRFIGGIGVGGASVVAPMYIAEISPAHCRGRLVAVTQFNIVLGILLAFFSNFLIARLHIGPTEWRWMFGVEAVPAAAFLVLLLWTPYSPRWLVMRNRIEEARQVLSRLGTDSGSVDGEIREIQASIDLEHHSLREPLFQRKYLKPVLLAVAIAAFNQLSGINALMYYAPHIFRLAGEGTESALLQTVAVGGTNLVFTMAALLVIDHFGRRKLMLAGSIGYILSLSATAVAFYAGAQPASGAAAAGGGFSESMGLVVLIGLLVFIASHAFGQGAVIWVFISEIFPNRVRARGQALGSFTHWFMAALISWTFPVIAAESGGHAFAFYAVMMVFQLLWVLYVMPETRGVPLEQIQRRLGID
ncbi:MAG: sugar porter family MFS transporter [Acidobacteriota bacterium]